MKAGATQAVQKAQEAGKAGQAKIEETRAKHHLDGLFRDLGAALYADHAGRATAETAANITRLYSEIEAHEAENGEASDASESDSTDESSGDTPAEGFKL